MLYSQKLNMEVLVSVRTMVIRDFGDHGPWATENSLHLERVAGA